jgi:hypothetical protein
MFVTMRASVTSAAPRRPRSNNNDQGGYSGGSIAYARNPAHQEIEAEADLCSRNAEHIVQKGSDVIKMFVCGVCWDCRRTTGEHVESVTD